MPEGSSGPSSAGELAAGGWPHRSHHRPLHHLCPVDAGKDEFTTHLTIFASVSHDFAEDLLFT